jgi:hypothetical protein
MVDAKSHSTDSRKNSTSLTTTSSSKISPRSISMMGEKQTKSESIKSLLSTPTNNYGLGLLFKKFQMLSG